MVGLLGLDPAAYTPSALHHPDRTFPETNCYVDLWIELLHALGIDPLEIRLRNVMRSGDPSPTNQVFDGRTPFHVAFDLRGSAAFLASGVDL